MARRRFLPPFVTAFADRHGKERLRFRRKGYRPHYFKAQLGTEEFRKEYQACLAGKNDSVASAIERTVPGSIAEAVTRYISVPSRLGPTETTQTKIRAIMSKFRDDFGDGPDGPRMVADCDFEIIDIIVDRKKSKRRNTEGRMEGGVEAARKLRKELIRFFDFCRKSKMIDHNPAADSERVKVAPGQASKGFHTWTEQDIAQYRKRHELGTKARLAMELVLWTDQRGIDAMHLGRQHIRDGRFDISQTKTGKGLRIKVAPQLLAAISAMKREDLGDMCFLVTDRGQPFTRKGFGNKMRQWCDEAGLPHCSAHGLRKAMMRRMAELEMGNQTMKAVSGHTKDDEVARYTAAANQMKLADSAIAQVSKWEMSNLDTRLDTSPDEGTENVA
jgi:integrase